MTSTTAVNTPSSLLRRLVSDRLSWDINCFDEVDIAGDFSMLERKDNLASQRMEALKWIVEIKRILLSDHCGESCIKSIDNETLNDMARIFSKFLNKFDVSDNIRCSFSFNDIKFEEFSTMWYIDICGSNETCALYFKAGMIDCISIIVNNSNDNNQIKLLMDNNVIKLIVENNLLSPISCRISNDVIVINEMLFGVNYQIFSILFKIAGTSGVFRNRILKYNVNENFYQICNECINAYGSWYINYNISKKGIDLVEATLATMFALLSGVDKDGQAPAAAPTPAPTEYIVETIHILKLFNRISNNNNNNIFDGITCIICKILNTILFANANIVIADNVFAALANDDIIPHLVNLIRNKMINYDSGLKIIKGAIKAIITFSRNTNARQISVLMNSGILDLMVPLVTKAIDNLTDTNFEIIHACLMIIGHISGGTQEQIQHVMVTYGIKNIVSQFAHFGIFCDNFNDNNNNNNNGDSNTNNNRNSNNTDNNNNNNSNNKKVCTINTNVNRNKIHDKNEPIKIVSILKEQLNPLVIGYVRQGINQVFENGMNNVLPCPKDVGSIVYRYCDNSNLGESGLKMRRASSYVVRNATRFGITDTCGFTTLVTRQVILSQYFALDKESIDLKNDTNLQLYCDNVEFIVETYQQLCQLKVFEWQKLFIKLNSFDKCDKLNSIIEDTGIPVKTREIVSIFLRKLAIAATE